VAEEETLRPVAWTFGAFGGFWGTWAVAAADVQHRLHLSDGGLGLMLTGSVVAGGVLAAAVGQVTHRVGTARAMATALGAWGLCVLGAAVAPGAAAFFAALVAALVVAGTVDSAMNTAVAIGARGDPATMVRFHALFNAGALAGAALTGILLVTGSSWQPAFAVEALVCLTVAVVARRAPLPGARRGPGAPAHGQPAPGDAAPGPLGWGAVRALHLRALAGVFLATALVEGGIDTWGVLYLRTRLGAGVLLGAGAYATGQAIAVGVRWSSARRVGRAGARAGLVVGAGVAAAGLALEATAPSPAPAGLGLLVAIGGIALCWPLVMAVVSAAGAVLHPRAAVGAPGGAIPVVVGTFTAIGYLGWVAGPGIVGWVADAAGLRAGFALLSVVAGAAAAVLVASTAAAPAR